MRYQEDWQNCEAHPLNEVLGCVASVLAILALPLLNASRARGRGVRLPLPPSDISGATWPLVEAESCATLCDARACTLAPLSL
jgi:hypothetical protein